MEYYWYKMGSEAPYIYGIVNGEERKEHGFHGDRIELVYKGQEWFLARAKGTVFYDQIIGDAVYADRLCAVGLATSIATSKQGAVKFGKVEDTKVIEFFQK